MKARHLEDILLEAYEAGQIRASDWEGFIPTPIPEIYAKQFAKEARTFASRFSELHHPEIMHYWCNGFLDGIASTH